MKNLSKKTSAQLVAIYKNANEADQAAIADEIEQRGEDLQTLLAEAEEAEADKLDEAEEAFLEELENNTNIEKPNTPKKDLKERLTLATAEELRKTLEPNVGHKCRVVPFNEIEWHDGYIFGVVVEKRSIKVMYIIKLDNGTKIVKAHDSKFLTILEETVEIVRGRSTSSSEKLDDEALMAKATECAINVGKKVVFAPGREIEMVRESDGAIVPVETLEGIITGIVPEKRARKILYRIEAILDLHDTTGGEDKTGFEADGRAVIKKVKTTFHKVDGASDLTISDEYDEETRASYLKRSEAYALRKNLSTADKIAQNKKDIEKTQASIKKLNDLLSAQTESLTKLEAQLEAELLNEANAPEAPAEPIAE